MMKMKIPKIQSKLIEYYMVVEQLPLWKARGKAWKLMYENRDIANKILRHYQDIFEERS